MAMIELADSTFACSKVVVCLDRAISGEDGQALMKNLQWVGFELITLDAWSGKVDTTSNKWLFLSMEV